MSLVPWLTIYSFQDVIILTISRDANNQLSQLSIRCYWLRNPVYVLVVYFQLYLLIIFLKIGISETDAKSNMQDLTLTASFPNIS